MSGHDRPTIRPANPNFSTGPCAKHPGWSLDGLADAPISRSHRAKVCRARLAEVIERSRDVLGMPADWRLGIVPGSDTGAVEMAMWNLLGPRGVDLLAWESFGHSWVTDAVKQLKIDDTRVLAADYGEISDLSAVDPSRDTVFTWNGTTSGVRVPNGTWIASERGGVTICDATSAVFAMDLPWDKLDAVTWSWQKVLGGEGAHGMLALSPRAVERIESHDPAWPMPKIFRLKKGDRLNEEIFMGATINTPSLLCAEDALSALKWAEEIGGLPALIARSEGNLKVVADWVSSRDWIDFLPAREEIRSCTSICLKIVDPWFLELDETGRRDAVKRLVALLEDEGVANDINTHRDAPPGLRIWGGATVEASDMEALLPWLDWGFHQVKSKGAKAA